MNGINVREAPFGAAGDGVTDDTPAIQAAINHLASNRGGTLEFPAGEYVVNEPGIVVPRGSGLRISLRGVGRSASSLYGGNLESHTPLFKYDDVPGSIIDGVWENLSIQRGNPGKVFECLSSGDHQRMVGCVFRNLHFQCVGLSGDLVVIQGMLHCLLDTVSFQGGAQSLTLSGSHFETHNLSTTADHAQVNALKLVGGNCSHQNTRIEACAGGVGVWIQGANHVFNGVYFEGKRTRTQMLIDHGSFNIEINHPALSAPTAAGGIGILCKGTHDSLSAAANVKVNGGISMADFTFNKGCYLMKVESGCRQIHVDRMQSSLGMTRVGNENEPPGSQNNNYFVEEGVYDVRIALAMGASNGDRTIYTAGVVGDYGRPFTDDVARLAVDEIDMFRVAFTAPTNVTDLTRGGIPGGFEGQQVRLIFTNGNTTLMHGTGNLRLAGGGDIHAVTNQVVSLVCDGNHWYGG
jgi:hypothetical protein